MRLKECRRSALLSLAFSISSSSYRVCAASAIVSVFSLPSSFAAMAQEVLINRCMILTKPSVSNALKRLHNRGYLDMKEDKLIALTELGQKTAEQVYEKHSAIKACLIRMGVDADIADKDACQMEHVVSQETLKRMQTFVGGENCY